MTLGPATNPVRFTNGGTTSVRIETAACDEGASDAKNAHTFEWLEISGPTEQALFDDTGKLVAKVYQGGCLSANPAPYSFYVQITGSYNGDQYRSMEQAKAAAEKILTEGKKQ